METHGRIRMFGGLRVECGQSVVTRFKSQKIGALLAFLAYHCEQPHSREMLVDLLWPEDEPEVGRHNLRTALHWLRRYLESDDAAAGSVVIADRLMVQLNPELISTDTAEFTEAVALAGRADSDPDRLEHLRKAVDLYQGELLPGYYQEWVVKEQRRLADLFFMACRRLTALHRESGNLEDAINCARRSVAVDPLREEAHQDLIRALVAAGQPTAALHQYEDLKRILRRDLDEEPSKTTRELAEEIQRRMIEGEPLDLDAPPAVLTILVARADRPATPTSTEEKPSSAPTAWHQDLFRDVRAEFPEAQPVVTHGDALAVGFGKASDAVRFALLVQSSLQNGPEQAGRDALLNIGIHLGEIGTEEAPAGDESANPLAMHLDVGFRLTELASGGQILMTAGVFDSARPTLKNDDLPGIGDLCWLSHGPYLLAGFDEPCIICEVGERGKAPLRMPSDGAAGKSIALSGTDVVLGWRPAVGQWVPGSEWVLREKLGEGGFGEVWRARHQATEESRVFKFCFRADRLRALKREMTLFRLLREALGDRSDIARLHNVQFEEAPYYLELEDTPGGNLAEWMERQGGCDKLTLETRLEIVSQIATALAAAHSVGVIHKDVKPSNVLVEEKSGTGVPPVTPRAGLRRDEAVTAAQAGRPCHVQVRLTDFGIGEVKDRDVLARAGITVTGFTETLSSPTRSSYSGTRMYMAPELLAGKQPSVQSDIYSLGVLFYQLVVGDLSRPMTTDWEREVRDPLLREDLRECLAGNPVDRFAGAADVARRLRSLPQRRKRRRYARIAQVAAGLFVLLFLISGAGLLFQSYQRKQANAALARETKLRQRAEESEENARRELYYSSIALAEKLIKEHSYKAAQDVLTSCSKKFRHWEWGRLQYLCNLDLVTLQGHTEPVTSVAFSPDGRRIATGSEGRRGTTVIGAAILWDAATGREIATLEGAGWAVAFSPDGTRVASNGVIYDATTGSKLIEVLGRVDSASVAFSPDGKNLATGIRVSANTANTVGVFDVETGRILQTLRGHESRVMQVAFSRDGRRLVTASWDNTAKIWDLETGREILTLEGHTDPVASAVFSPDGRRVATASHDLTAKIWDAETGEELRTFVGHGSGLYSVAFSPDGRHVVTASQDREAKIWDAETAREIWTLGGHTDTVWHAVYDPDGRYVATASADKTAKIWDAESSREVIVLSGHEDPVGCVAFSPDGTRVATASYDKTVRIWDVELGRELFQLLGHSINVWSAAFSPDGQRIVTASNDGTARIWDARTGAEILCKTLRGEVYFAAFSPDGRLVLTGGQLGEAQVWDANTGEELRTFNGHFVPIYPGGFSPDGKRIVTGSGDTTARTWDVETGRELRTLSGHKDAVVSAGFSPDGRRILTASSDKTARLWNAETGEELLTLAGHGARLGSATFSPDGRRIATASMDGSAKVWDAETGRELLTLKQHGIGTWNVAFSRDGFRIATTGVDRTGAIWNACPWDDEDLPGDAGTSYPARLQLWKLNKWEKRQEALTTGPMSLASPSRREQATSAAIALEDPDRRRARRLDNCAKNLRAIHVALNLYRNESAGKRPDWLSDLVPDYLSSRTLLCPCDPQGVSGVTADPNAPCSYNYLFAPFERSPATGNRREPKMMQLLDVTLGGPRVPTVVCYHHGFGRHLTLNHKGLLHLEGGSRYPQVEYRSGMTTASAAGDGGLSATSDVCLAERIVESAVFAPLVPISVRLNLAWRANAESLKVVDNVPEGWAVKNVSHDGEVRGSKIRWEIAPWTSPGVTLEYTATPPAGNEYLPAAFANAFVRAKSGGPMPIADTLLSRSGILVFQDGAHPGSDYAGCDDTHITFNDSDNNMGRCEQFEDGDNREGTLDHKKLLVRFDLSSVGQSLGEGGSTFTLGRAELRLHAFGEYKSGKRNIHTVYAARLLKPWGEGQGVGRDGAPAREGEATFNSARHGLLSWEKAGALGLTDVADCESAATVGDNWPEWVTLDVTESVRDFLTTPSLNLGWKISQDPVRGVEDPTIQYAAGIYMYESSEAPEIRLRPMLVLLPPETAEATKPIDAARGALSQWRQEFCATNLYRIHAALVRYREEHGGSMPTGLRDLVPDYLSPETLLCPCDEEALSSESAKSLPHCSYRYASRQNMAKDRQIPNRTAKAAQLQETRSVAPTVRCHHHDGRVLNLSRSGDLYFSSDDWQTGPREDYLPPEIQPLARAKAGSSEEFLALQREFKLAEGRYGQWERLPELARRLVSHPAADAGILHDMSWEIVDTHRRNLEAAVLLARGAVKLEPENSVFLDTLGWAEVLVGDYTNAIEHFEKALERSTGVPGMSRAGMALAFARSGEINRAWDSLANALFCSADYRREAFVEVSRAGPPSNPKLEDKVKRLGGCEDPRPEFELITTQPLAGEKVEVLYRPRKKISADEPKIVLNWGVNRWQYPGDEAATTESAVRICTGASGRPTCIQQPMTQKGDVWTATLLPPRWARQIDLMVYSDQTRRCAWGGRGREAHVSLLPPGSF